MTLSTSINMECKKDSCEEECFCVLKRPYSLKEESLVKQFFNCDFLFLFFQLCGVLTVIEEEYLEDLPHPRRVCDRSVNIVTRNHWLPRHWYSSFSRLLPVFLHYNYYMSELVHVKEERMCFHTISYSFVIGTAGASCKETVRPILTISVRKN